MAGLLQGLVDLALTTITIGLAPFFVAIVLSILCILCHDGSLHLIVHRVQACNAAVIPNQLWTCELQNVLIGDNCRIDANLR